MFFFLSVSNAKCSHFLQKIKHRSKFDFCLNRHNKQHIGMISETLKKCIVIYNEIMRSIHQVHRGVSNLTRLVSFRNFKKAIQTGLDFSCILYCILNMFPAAIESIRYSTTPEKFMKYVSPQGKRAETLVHTAEYTEFKEGMDCVDHCQVSKLIMRWDASGNVWFSAAGDTELRKPFHLSGK